MKITVSYKAGHFGLLVESKYFNLSAGAGRPPAKISSLRADRINYGNISATPTTKEPDSRLENALGGRQRNSFQNYYEEELARELKRLGM